MSGKIKYSPMPPKQAIDFFKKKGYALGFDWRDVWKEEHAIAFTVAKAASIDLLQDIRSELDKALAEGLTFESFKKNLKPRLVECGWWGKAIQTDPLTGEEQEVMLGSNRRLKTIWRTNIDMAYAAGNWEQYELTKRTHPYLKYHCLNLPTSRAQHKAWDGIVLPVDDSWWNTHYVPNDFGCKCWIEQISKNAVMSGKVKVSARPAEDYVEYRNKRTGEISRIPKGISPGFDYNVGKARARAFTPPPLGGLPQTCQNHPAKLPPLPKAEKIPDNTLMSPGLPIKNYTQAFLSVFGADEGKTAYFTDKVGDVLPINADLFRNFGKNENGPYLKLLALGIFNPDEIWLQWVKNAAGTWLLQKRYLKRWAGIGKQPSLSVFDKTADGWKGAALSEEADNYRDGLLLYKKGLI